MKKDQKKLPAEKKTVHFIFIEESRDKVAAELMKWDEALWWPKNPGIRIKRQTPGAIQVGTIFTYKLPLVPAWTAEVATFSFNRTMVSAFQSPFLKGEEIIRIEERANGTKVEYEIRYRIAGLLNKFLWAFFGDKAYRDSIKKILNGFRDFMIERVRQDQEKKFEGKS